MAGLTREERQRRELEAQQVEQRKAQEAERQKQEQGGQQPSEGLQRARQDREQAQVDQGGDDATAQRRQQAKLGQEFGGTAYVNLDEQLERQNAIDERMEDRRPATLRSLNPAEPYEDNRTFAGDVGKACNQMIGRVFITENNSPHPRLDNPLGPIYPQADTGQDGEQIVLLKGYQPYPEKEGGPLPPKLQAGSVAKVPMKVAKRLINDGAAKFLED